jgi:hypothetical protein
VRREKNISHIFYQVKRVGGSGTGAKVLELALAANQRPGLCHPARGAQ